MFTGINVCVEKPHTWGCRAPFWRVCAGSNMFGVENPAVAVGASVNGDLQLQVFLLWDNLVNTSSKCEKHSETDSLSLLLVLVRSYWAVKNRQNNHLRAFEMYVVMTDIHKFWQQGCFSFSALLLVGDLLVWWVTDKTVQKRETVLVKRHSNICSFFPTGFCQTTANQNYIIWLQCLICHSA